MQKLAVAGLLFLTFNLLACTGNSSSSKNQATAAQVDEKGELSSDDATFRSEIANSLTGVSYKENVQGDSGGIFQLFANLDRQTISLNCGLKADGKTCDSVIAGSSKAITVAGDKNTIYDVEIRVKGQAEAATYKQGLAEGQNFYVGGEPSDNASSVFRINTASPEQSYFLNARSTAVPSEELQVLDYTAHLRVAGGSTLTLEASAPASKDHVSDQSLEISLVSVSILIIN